MFDRMLLSEAIDAVRKLISYWPNGGNGAGDGYIGALAAVLCDYPRQVVLRCIDPRRGVSKETKFLPTVSDLIGWLEWETEPLRRDVAREERIAVQFAARGEHLPHSERLTAMTQAWLNRSDPQAQELIVGLEADKVARRQAGLALIEAGNKRVLDEERAIVGTTELASPSLRKLLQKNELYERI